MTRITPVVLSGGSGTRLWPLSRSGLPKQVLALADDNRSLLQSTLARVTDPTIFTPPLIIAADDHRFLVAEHCREINVAPQGILLEPVGRNTAPAAAVAALFMLARDACTVLCLLPADHAIAEDDRGLQAAMGRALPAAEAGKIVTFGIQPQRAATEYGYIHRGKPLNMHEGLFEVADFVEKPDEQTATGYIRSGGYLWNSGMFLARADALVKELAHHAPEVLEAAKAALYDMRSDLDFHRLDRAALETAPSISFDHAVMEHTRQGAVLPCSLDWSDLGTWPALWEREPRDDKGNVLRGLVRLHDSEGCYLRSEEKGPLVAALGLRDLIVVATGDAVLVVPKARAAELGTLVNKLKTEERPEVLEPAAVHRPWGSYENLAEGDGFRAKRITVKPGGRLSLQYHHHRSEHWVVVSGRATVTRGNSESELEANESIYVPVGEAHRLENRGDGPLVLIEVQCGDYLGEDDIVRLDDVYGRVPEAPG